MTRTLLASAAALIAATTLFGSVAMACISCEYVPEVARSAPPQEAKPYVRQRSYAVQRERSPAKKRVVKSAPAVKAVETAEKAPIKTDAKTENSSIARAPKSPVAETAKVEPKAVAKENSSIAVASTERAAPAKVSDVEAQAAAKSVDCKKFFPSVGMTLSVPCE